MLVNTSDWWPADAPADSTARLAMLGWDADWQRAFTSEADDGRRPGRVARVDRGFCTLLTGDGTERAMLGSRALEPAVGDWTAHAPPTEQSGAILTAILPRRSQFLRHAAGEQTTEQVVASNIDVVFVVNALDRRLSVRRIERYLTLTWQSGANPVILLTKSDVAEDAVEAAIAETQAVAFGTPIHPISAVTGEGLDVLARYHEANQTVALIGLSGAGKSTLVNRLLGEDRLRTAAVRADGKGRHTTTHRELVPLPGGGVLIDTPGMRAVGLWEAENALEQTFADIEELAASCRFSDCTHDHEPGCAVVAAIEAGTLGAERLASYDKLQRELHHQELKVDARARADERRRWRNLNRAMRDSARQREGG
jgi:ribosome biogenesis GTPase / thiamine phosphate phosphatase